MKRSVQKMLGLLVAAVLSAELFVLAVQATEVTEDPVQQVTAQLEAVDTLQEMQAARYTYTVSERCDIGTTDSAIITAHETARSGYETYVSKMFAARMAAQQAYDALTDAQKAQIDPALVAKLSGDLSTVFKTGTYSVTPSDNAYTFEAVNGGTGYGYEVSNYMVSGQIPQTFILVDTADGKTTWTPSGRYVYGQSNYDVTYCCDVLTPLSYGTHYKRVNLEDSHYYGADSARHIRAILQNSYPYLTMDQMKANLKAAGLGSAFVDSLNRADMIAAVQMAVWTYANAADGAQGGLEYFASIDIPKNNGIYFTPLHDYTNELWEWFPGKKSRSYDARAAYRVNNLAYYLCNLPGEDPAEDEIVISDVKVSRAELIPGSDDTYQIGMYIYLNNGGSGHDDLKITVSSYSADGAITGSSNQQVNGQDAYQMTVKAKVGDTIKVTVEGTQYLGRGVYFYEPEGGRDVSQSLVGVSEGSTRINAEETFVFHQDIEMGLRIYKTAVDSKLPISDITFHIYQVTGAYSAIPTEEEVAQYAVPENLVGSGTTDATGYATIPLEKGVYLVVEEHNAQKVEAPVDPFYVTVPMPVEEEPVTGEAEVDPDTDTGVSVIYRDIVSVYPKNTPVIPPDTPPVIPPAPDNVTGMFSIVKHDKDDSSIRLEGAEFNVYRPATEDDADTVIITCDGVEYAAVLVTTLTTGTGGTATSPSLTCGPYFLVETKAPDGYDLLEEAVSVTVISSEVTQVTTVEIANQRGSILPETGGAGTHGFWFVGSVLTLAAVVLLVTKKRMAG